MSTNNQKLVTLPPNAPWDNPWPANELECVAACPVCGSTDRRVLHEGLIDNVFFVAPGKWVLQSCQKCRSAYLDPRPTVHNIGKAYGTYYTHTDVVHNDNAIELGLYRRIRRMISSGYLNQRFGTQLRPASCIGKWVTRLLPMQREMLDTEYRYLPKPSKGQRLLDIGCGNGDFLVTARKAGWEVSGVEPDPKAAIAAGKQGVDVTLGTVDLLANQSNCFDAITLSHVIEHVHEPKKLLEAVQRLLKPGGVVSIDTPNIQSHGATLYKKSWRGIEAPRHLVLFNSTSLSELLNEMGFSNVNLKRRSNVKKDMYLKSQRIASGNSPYGKAPARLGCLEQARLYLKYTKTAQLEFITLVAEKSKE